jgi:beta-galactosidase/beta-glucuronidase
VPSCWEEQEEDYQGVAWYQTVVPIATDQAGKVCRIRFEAANYRTQVWVNGHNVGLHEGGYTPFEFQIQQALLYGENNTITVRVISPIITEDRQIDGLSTNDMPHWRGGLTAGLWQSVSLHFNRAAWIESAFYKPDVAQSAFHLELNVHSQHTESSPYTLQVTLHDASGQEVVTHNSQVELQQGEQLLKASLCLENPILWDCDNPHLYTAIASLNDGQSKLDQSEERIGLREFTYVNDHFELNGQRIYLRGGFWEGVYAKHQSYPESREEVRREIKLAQEAGFNLLRPWRRPVPPMILEEADAAGLLIIASPAVECMSCWPSLTPETPQRIEYEIRSLGAARSQPSLHHLVGNVQRSDSGSPCRADYADVAHRTRIGSNSPHS